MQLKELVQINPEAVREGYPYAEINYIDISSVGTGSIDKLQPLQLSEAPSRAKRIVRSGDTILATVRPNLRSFCYLKNPPNNAIASTGFAVLRATEKIDPRFLYFTVIDQSFTDFLCANVKGAAYPAVDSEAIGRAEINLPTLLTQRRIASILSAYDDLIENNTRRIAILEEMARRIYEEWFVRFRFPGHEKVKMVESELGLIPEGWNITKLKDHLIKLESGKRPKGGIVNLESGIPSIGAENINGIGKHNFSSEKLVSEEFFTQMRKGVVQNGDVAVYKDGAYIGRSSYFRDSFPHARCCVNEHVFLLRSDGVRLKQNFFYLWLQQEETVSAIRSTNANAAQPGINQQTVGGLELLIPDVETAAKFDELVEPMLAAIINYAKKNTNLRTTRDLLLPKLISGELDVSNLPELESIVA